MKYDFDKIISRKGTNSCKWDSIATDDILPMWVADMDFQTAPAIIEAIQRRVSHGIFGYTHVPDKYYHAVTDWFKRRHGLTIGKDWIIYTSGVVPALSAIIKALTQPGDQVLIQTPVYNCFFSSIRNNECEIVTSPLIRKDQTYYMDFEDLEKKTADEKLKLMILCNPHNPAGRVWTKEELTRVGEICLRNNVIVIADEIHCELVYPPKEYTPFASISDDFLQHSITCLSPSKAFNIAGLQIANIVSANEDFRKRINRAININEVCDVNPFGIIATIAAYNDSGQWLDALRKYLWENYEYLCHFFEEHLPQYSVLPLEGTYLVWIDCRASGIGSDAITLRLQKEQKLLVNSGTMYGPSGEGFIRLNIACPRILLADGLERILKYIRKHMRLLPHGKIR